MFIIVNGARGFVNLILSRGYHNILGDTTV